jgi:hypothetical protein
LGQERDEIARLLASSESAWKQAGDELGGLQSELMHLAAFVNQSMHEELAREKKRLTENERAHLGAELELLCRSFDSVFAEMHRLSEHLMEQDELRAAEKAAKKAREIQRQREVAVEKQRELERDEERVLEAERESQREQQMEMEREIWRHRDVQREAEGLSFRQHVRRELVCLQDDIRLLAEWAEAMVVVRNPV